jgi:hypothetical protein
MKSMTIACADAGAATVLKAEYEYIGREAFARGRWVTVTTRESRASVRAQ